MKRFAIRTMILAIFTAGLILTASAVLSAPAYAADEVKVDYGLPVIYLNIDETGENPSIEDMNTSPDHSVTCVGTIRIEVPDGFTYSDAPGKEISSTTDLGMTIRGRGNSTWARFPKRPYKIKLDSKADLFGLGKNKHWVLVANYYDHSLVKDRMTAWLGDKMGFEFTPQGFPVDVVMTGTETESEYLGSYYFSENVRVDTNRLEIQELNESDTTLPTISGGYLVQNSAQVRQGSPDRFITKHGVGWATHTPSFDTEEYSRSLTGSLEDQGEPEENEELFNDPEPAYDQDVLLGADAYENHEQQEYIQSYIQMVEDALYEGGTGYRDVMDLKSAAKYWLVNTFALNHDGYSTGSTYIYKYRYSDILYWGPLWDFDFAWYYDETYQGMDLRHEWLEPLFYDTGEGGFVEEVEKQWLEMRPYLVKLAEEGGILDGYCAETKKSADADRAIWRPYEEDFDYEAEIEEFKIWINNRIAWMDENISTIEHIVHKVRFVAGDEVFEEVFAKDGTIIEMPYEVPAKDGYVFLGWVDADGAPADPRVPITRDITYTANFIPESEAVQAEDIAFHKTSDIQKRGFYVSGYEIQYTVIPENAQDKRIEWTSSDESFATVDSDGMVTYVDKGEGLKSVTITATLSNGISRDFTLYLTDETPPTPESISPEKEQIEMSVGGQAAFTIVTSPDPALIGEYSYYSEDESVVKVDPYRGVLTATGPGQTRVHVVTTSGETECETFTTVTVGSDPVLTDINKAEVSGLGNVKYTGSAIQPEPVVTLGGKTLVNGTDYRLAYSANKKVGTANIVIEGIGQYTGSRTETFKIVPKGTKITKLTRARKAIKVKWKKQKTKMSASRITGYQIQVATDKKFTKNKKMVTVKGYNHANKKITKLKASRKYYVRIRTYKTVKGKRYYSAWSKVKTVKTR